MNFYKQIEGGYRLTGKAKMGLTLGVLGALLQGCGPGAAGLSILGTGQSTFQGSLANNKVDILWVIDNSGTMLTKQQNLANGFDSFSTVFVNKGFDFRMAIVTSDTRAGPTGQAGQFQGTPKVITPQTPSFANTFKSNVVVGSFGDPNAKALDAIELALSNSLLTGANSDFLRSDSHLAVIIVSDADDNDSTATVNSVKTFLNNLKPDKFDVVSRTYKKNFTVSTVAVDTSNTSFATCPVPFENGLKFKQLSGDTNGSFASICEADFSAGLTNLSNRIAEAITEIPLAREPVPATIQVWFNGAAVANNDTNGWQYVAANQKIVFRGTAIPNDNTSISIAYLPKDIIR
jgi:hypothetical protein